MGRIINIYGGDSQVGTTMLAQSMAKELQTEEQKVLLFCISGNPAGEYFTDSSSLTLDQLIGDIKLCTLSKSKVKEYIRNNRGLTVLLGPEDLSNYNILAPEDIKYVLGIVRDQFDFIVCDSGSNIASGSAIGCLTNSDENYFVITQQPKSINRFSSVGKNVIQPLNIGGKLIVNKYLNQGEFYSITELQVRCGFKAVGSIPYIEYGWQAEYDRSDLLSYYKYRRGVREIITSISNSQDEKGKSTKTRLPFFGRTRTILP